MGNSLSGSPSVLQGILRGARSTKKPKKQSRVLEVKEVAALEDFFKRQDVHSYDRYACAMVLFMIYSRARLSDLKQVSGISMDLRPERADHGYVEVATWEHKTMRSSAMHGLPPDEEGPQTAASSKPDERSLNWATGCEIYLNQKTGTMHLRAFVCGRQLTADTSPVERETSGGIRCKQCVVGRNIRDVDSMVSFMADQQAKRPRLPDTPLM